MKPTLQMICLMMAQAAVILPAQTVAEPAVGSRSYRSTGPATPAGNQDNLNVGGTSQGSFASWAAIDFSFSAADFGGPVAGVSQLSLSLFKDDQVFTAGGVANFYLAPVTTLPLTDSSLVFNNTYVGGIDPSAGTLGALFFLGSANVVQANGATDGQLASFDFTLSGAASTFLADQINTGDNVLRILITPGDAAAVMSFAGVTNPNFGDPQLTLTAVPEPSTYAGLAGLVAIGIALGRRRQAFQR